VSPRYFPRVQTPLIEGGLSCFAHIYCTPSRGKVGGYELGVEVASVFRLATAFDELRLVI